MNPNDWGDVIAHQAKQWNGKEFAPGAIEQCMNWVRKVLEQVAHPYTAKVTRTPVDGHWTGPSLASSLAGRDLGEMITSTAKLEAGDILFWDDTYYTGFPPKTITHVGIALSNSQFVHRNTVSKPVNIQPYEGIWRTNFRAGLRVPQLKADPSVKAPVESATVKLWVHQGGSALQLRQELAPGRYSLFSTGSATDGAWLLKVVSVNGVRPAESDVHRVWINGNGATLDLRQGLKPGSYHVVSSGSESGGALLVKLVPR